MGPIKERVICDLRSARRAKGLSQSELAERVGVKRQAICETETGRYVPNTVLALRMAKQLGCSVEDLFILDKSQDAQPVTLVEKAAAAHTRVSVTRVRKRLIAYPLDGKWLLSDWFQPADGLLASDSSSVQLIRQDMHMENKLLLLGCDPAFSILGAHVSRCAPEAGVYWRYASSHLALERLATGYAHIAGTHFHDTSSGQSDVEFAKTALSGSKAMIVAFAFVEEGLVVERENPHQIRSVADLAKEGVRFVNCEPGAAVRILLDERLARAGVTRRSIRGYDNLAASGHQCAQMVALNVADAALGFHAVASAYGLDFIPMGAMRCDLVIPCEFMDLPAVKVLLDVLQTGSLREEISSLPGYDSACTGKVIGWVL